MRREGKEAADVGTPHPDAGGADRQRLVHGGFQAIKTKADGRVAAPDNRRAGRRTGPAGTDKTCQRFTRVCRRGSNAAVVVARVAVVEGSAGHAVRRYGIERGVLAKIFHPALVAVFQGFVGQRAIRIDAALRTEIELTHCERARRLVVVDVGVATRFFEQGAMTLGDVEFRLVIHADHRVEIRVHRCTRRVARGSEFALRIFIAALCAARQVVRKRRGH
jgi:hypothetical protein